MYSISSGFIVWGMVLLTPVHDKVVYVYTNVGAIIYPSTKFTISKKDVRKGNNMRK